MTKVLFLTSANLTTNPRLKKEFELAKSLGWEITFVGFDLQNWSNKIENNVKQNLQNVKLVYLSASKRKPSFLWLFSTVIEKIAKILYVFFPQNLALSAFAHSKRSFSLWWRLFWHKKKYDLVIAHTLPAIYPAYRFAQRVGAKWIFDVEDYHPGEKIVSGGRFERSRREQLLRELLPRADAFTYASPLIGEFVLRLVGEKRQLPPHLFVANSFPARMFRFVPPEQGVVRFVWFSQNIAPGRGLELLVPALWEFKSKVRLTLIGNLYPGFWEDFLKQYSQILEILPPMEEESLYAKLCEFDVGCAVEMSDADLNKQLALSNKIFAYAQAGLFIMATDTRAQAKFISENPVLGTLVMQYLNDFQRKVDWIIENIDGIRKAKRRRYDYARRFAWENEAQKLRKLWQRVLDV